MVRASTGNKRNSSVVSSFATAQVVALSEHGRFQTNTAVGFDYKLDTKLILFIKAYQDHVFKSIQELQETIVDQVNTKDLAFEYFLHCKKDSKYIELRCKACDKLSYWFGVKSGKVNDRIDARQEIEFARSNNKNHCALQHGGQLLKSQSILK